MITLELTEEEVELLKHAAYIGLMRLTEVAKYPSQYDTIEEIEEVLKKLWLH